MEASILSLKDAPVPHHEVSAENIVAASDELTELLGSSAISHDTEQCYSRSNTPWSPASFEQRPALILLPSTTEDVSGIMRICSKRRVPIVAYSGGTGLQGSLTATRGGFCVDFSRMDKILAVHEDDMDAVVQPGVGWQELNKVLDSKRLFFPPDPSPDARIGGMVSKRAGDAFA